MKNSSKKFILTIALFVFISILLSGQPSVVGVQNFEPLPEVERIQDIEPLLAGERAQNNEPLQQGTSATLRAIPNEAFGFGEKLDYKVGYKFITAGTGYFWIQPKPVIRGDNHQCYDIRFRVQSLESLRWVYKVDDNYKTVLDVDGIFPWEFEQHVREGNYRKDAKAVFDQVNNFAYANDKKYNVPPYAHDIVSAFYYVRTQDLSSMKKGHIFYLQNFFEDTTYNLGVKIMGREIIEVDAGKFRCIVIQPLVVQGGLFKSEGNIYIWLTDDERKIPVKVATKIIIGYVGAELIKYSGIRGPINAKID